MSDKSIKYSVLELASVAAGSTPRDAFDNSVRLARHAEKLGYTRFWLAEHHNMISIASASPQILIGHIAGVTSKIRVGSGGIMLPNHSPLIVSEQFGTLGALYPDRIDLGLGRAPGTDQTTAHAIRPDRIQAVHSFPREVQQIQEYFSEGNAQSSVRAIVAEGVNVPIYILGSSTDSAYLAAEKGLPYAFASHFAPTHLFDALNIYYNNFKPSEQLKEPYSIAGINVLAADTDEQAERLATSLVRMMLGLMTNKLDYIQPPVDMTPEIRELMDNPAFQRMLKYGFIGSKDTVQQKTAQFLKETGVDEVMVASHAFDINDRIKSYTIFSEVMKELNQAPITQ